MRLLFIFLFAVCSASAAVIYGTVRDPDGQPVAGATVRADSAGTTTAKDGSYRLSVDDRATIVVTAEKDGFLPVQREASRASEELLDFRFTRLAPSRQSMTVVADAGGGDIQQPDPAQRVLVRDEILDANPGRPGAPVSIPGLPAETASSGIKAPQYFAPGVAGDHGEPIAQFLQVGSFPLPNNLSANAHGNGYADPNIMVPAIVESVETDGGAFNVREGDHSVNLAATYSLRPHFDPFLTFTADRRDVDLAAGWNWLTAEASYGNGLLDTPERRRQFKLNALKAWDVGAHHFTLLFLGYYGASKIPGLVPIGVPNLHDTIDSRQRDQTHTAAIVLNDVWRLTDTSELQLSGFFRTYNLALYSNFGDGLIRQSEFRTVAGGDVTYIRHLNRRWSVMAGLDYFREAPRRDDLDHYASTNPAIYGPFEKVTANNITLDFITSFAALEGAITPWLRFNAGWRRDQIDFQNTDLMAPGNSFQKWIGFNSPKATLSFVPSAAPWLPAVSLSFGEAFFTNDPRIGAGSSQGTPVSRSHSYQLVVEKTIARTDVRLTLGHITQSASLAKIDPDTGLQVDEGSSHNRYATFSARRYFGWGLLQSAISKADARDLSEGTPIPEAPRLILDALGTLDRLPFHLHARAEFEEVGRKPLGDSFVSAPVREFRGALERSFRDERLQAGVHFQLASGYTGQTLETLALPGEGEAFERVVGVYLPSYAAISFRYQFRRAAHQRP